jgi:hypothetical protein
VIVSGYDIQPQMYLRFSYLHNVIITYIM